MSSDEDRAEHMNRCTFRKAAGIGHAASLITTAEAIAESMPVVKGARASTLAAIVWGLMAFGTADLSLGQTQGTGGTCVPVSERAGRELGCFITARQALGKLPKAPLYWHLDTYPTRAAAEAPRGLSGAVVESFGKVWLFTIVAAGWRAAVASTSLTSARCR